MAFAKGLGEMTLASSLSARPRSFDVIVDALAARGPVKKLREHDVMALCPVHDDRTPSLHVTYKPHEEKTLVHCQACKNTISAADVMDALGLTVDTMFDKPLERTDRTDWKTQRPAKTRTKKTPRAKLPERLVSKVEAEPEIPKNAWQEVTRYEYTDDSGTVVQQVIRLEAVIDGERRKRFVQSFVSPATGRPVRTKPKGFTPVLYNQPAVKSAIAAGQPVWIVEGEKDADSAEAAGLVATTNAQGAGSWPEHLTEVFAGADVRVVVDRDASGAKWALSIHDQLQALEPAAQVALLLPAVEDAKADLTDHLDAGMGADDLVPVTAEDLRAAIAVGAAEVAGAQLADAAAEAEAQLEQQHVEQANLWAGETQRLWEKVQAAQQEILQLQLSSAGQQTAAAAVALATTALKARNAAHVAVGLPAIEEHLEEPAAVPAKELIGSDGGFDGSGGDDFDGSWGDDDDVENTAPVYRVRKGETVRVTRSNDKTVYQTVIRGWAHVIEERTIDDGQDSELARPRDSYVIRWFRWKRDDRGRPIVNSHGNHELEQSTMTIDAEMVQKKTWTQSLPWSGMLVSSKPSAIAQAWDAIFNARPVSSDTAKTVYVAPGWREHDLGRFFVHRSGAIGPNGRLDVPVRFTPSGPFSVYDLPDPVDDAKVLRQAWLAGTVPLQQHLPAKVLAPLLGTVWHSPFGKSALATHLMGARAAAKTGTAGLVCQYFAPLAHFHGRRKAMLSGSDSGSTFHGLMQVSSMFGNVPAIIDDFAPDGVPEKIRKKLGDFARAFEAGEAGGRLRMKREGGFSQNENGSIEFSPITTGELSADGSNLSRLLVIPLNPGDIDNIGDLYPKLETKQARDARAQLGANLIMYLARHWDALQEEADPENPAQQAMRTEWLQRLELLNTDSGAIGRYMNDAVKRHFGIRLMLRMLVGAGAISRDEATKFEAWFIEGLTEAYGQQESTGGDPAANFLQYLREALLNGRAYISDRDGQAPEFAQGALGWRLRGTFEGHDNWEQQARTRIGVIEGERLYLFPTTAFDVASEAANRAGETLSETTTSVGSSLVAHGWTERDGGKSTSRRRIGGVQQRVWDLHIDVLIGDEPGQPKDTGTIEPTPTPPTPPAAPVDEDPFTTPDSPDTDTPAQLEFEERIQRAPDVDEQPAARTNTAAAPAPAATVAGASQAPAEPPARPRRDHEYRAAVAVLDTRGLWLPNGTCVDVPAMEHFGTIAKLAQDLNLGARSGSWKSETPTIFITDDAALRLNIPVDQLPKLARKQDEFLKAETENHWTLKNALRDGWEFRTDEPWIHATTRIWAKGAKHYGVKLALIALRRDDTDGIFADNPSPATVAARFQKLADRNVPFAVSAKTTGFQLMEATVHVKDRDLRESFMTATTDPVLPATVPALEDDFNWTRKPTDDETRHELVHAYDRNGSYLAGVSGTYFGLGEPTHFASGHEFVKNKQGYYRVQLPQREDLDPRMPSPFGHHNDERLGRDAWVSAPTLEIANEIGLDLIVHEAYIWETSHRSLDSWAKYIDTARTELDTPDVDDQAARSIIKSIYVRAIGSIGSVDYHSGRRGFAPERRHAIQARARANMIRRIVKIGNATNTWPIAVHKDTLLYTSNNSDALAAWPGTIDDLGKGLGKYKHEGVAPMAEQLPYFHGGTYDGKFGIEKD